MVNDIAVQEFVDAIKEEPQDTNRTYNATVSRIDKEGKVWVRIHGSDKETPTASTSSSVKAGDNVPVEWRNNKLYIGGNYSNPSAGFSTVQPAIDFVAELVDKDVTVNSITAATGYIDDLYSKNITTENLQADKAYIGELVANSVTTNDITATVGYIGDLTADNITAADISADHALIEDLDVQSMSAAVAYIGDLTSEHITAQDIAADHATIEDLDVTYAKVTDLNAATGRISTLEANEVTINDTLKATNAEVKYLSSDWISTDRLVLTGNNKNNYPPVQITEAEFNANKTAYWTKDGDNYTQCTTSSVYDPDEQYYVRQSVKAIIEAINNANRYTEASPTQAEFNADKTSYYTYDGAEYIQCKSTDTYNSSTQYYIYDTQIVVSKDKLIAASMDVAELSAITADMGTLTAGKIQKGNNFINLNTSPATMEFKNADTWAAATNGLQWDALGNLNIKGSIEVTGGNVYSKEEIDESLGYIPMLEISRAWEGDNVTLTAKVYVNGEDKTDDYTASQFSWYRKSESDIGAFIGTGKSNTISLGALKYGGAVSCELWIPQEINITDSSGNNITGSDGNLIAVV